MSDNISKLYGALKNTYELGSEDDFRKYLSDGKKREALRKELESEYEVGDSASFAKYLGFDQPTPAATPKVYKAEDDTMGAGVGAAVVRPAADAVGTAAAKAQGARQSKQGYAPTWQEQWAMGITANSAGNTALNAAVPVEQQQQNSQTYQQKVMSQRPEIGRQGRVVEDNGGYITERGERHNVMVDANKSQQDLEASYTAQLQSQLNELYGKRSDIQKQLDNTPQDWVDQDGRVHTVSEADKAKRSELMAQYQANEEEIKNLYNNQRLVNEREKDPGFLGVTKNKLGAGFLKAGLGLLNGMEALAGGMIVEDASSKTGYSRAPEYNPNEPNNAGARGLKAANEYADEMSRKGEVRGGTSFTDLLLNGDIGGFLLKGWGTGLESLPMTLSAYNPYTMALNAISMAGNNFRENTIANPDIPTWKRAMMAVGSAAIEQAVEKYADPVFKYIGGGASKKVTQEVVDEATKTIGKRIYSVLKDAAGEGAEEVITNFGNDALGQALDWVDGESDYGIVAQWRDLKKKNPNADLLDFAMQKGKENVDSFFGGALAGAYTSAGAQATVAGLQYALGNTVSAEEITGDPSAPVHPVTLDIAQHYDNGYSLENDEEKKALSDSYRALRGQVEERLGEDVLNEIDRNPTAFISQIEQLDEETQQIVGEYISAKAGVDGIQQRIVEENRVNRPNFVVNGNNIDEVDAEGNVVATHEYDNADDMRAALWELEAKREHNDMMADILIAKANPKYDYDGIIGAFAEETGLDVDYIESVLNKDPLELEDPESAMVAEFAEMLHDTIYDNTSVHAEQSAQDGANMADIMGIDLNNLSPVQAQEAQQIATERNAAQQALEQAFAQNEDLKQEVERLQNEQMPEQGIVSTLGALGFRPDEVQAVIDFYNAEAKFNGFMFQMEQKINEAAANERRRHTHKGTINGVADVNNVHTITDGTNSYTLVSGDVTTDSDGRITGSSSGLIIGLDENGDFVNIKDTDGYSVLPPMQTLDQWEEGERIRLQEQMTGVIDPGQAMNPAANAAGTASGTTAGTEQSGVLNNAGGEAGVNGDTGANEPPATALSRPAANAAGTTAEGGVSEMQGTTIESVTDKDGIKRYENGIAVDDAIADMIASGDDVNEIADASIAEAQAVVDKINGKATKTRKDLVDRKKAQDAITYYNNVKARWAEVQQEKLPSESEENVNVQPEQPNVEEKTVSSQQETEKSEKPNNLTVEEQKQQRIAEAKAKYGELFDDDFTKANDVYELVSMWVGRKRNLAWDDVNGKRGLQKELGWTRKIGGDTKFIETLLAKKGEGMGVDEFAHMVWESPENDIMGEKRFSTEEIKEALLDLLKSAQSKSDVVDYALNTRIIAAEQALEAKQQMEQEMQEAGEVEEDYRELENTDYDLPWEPMTDEEAANDPFLQQFDENGKYIYNSNDNEYNNGSQGLDGTNEQGRVEGRSTESLRSSEGKESSSLENLRRPEEGESESNGANQLADVLQPSEPISVRTRTDRQAGSNNQKATEGAANSEGQGSPESVEDPYLQPRNAEEEQIIANVLSQLQQEIGEAVEEQNKARSELEKARTRESDRATDMFANDETFAEPDAIFSQEEMGLDTSAEGVERRTAAQREKLQEATNKLNQLQSLQERNSRVRGALDNYRRQTIFETNDPMEAIEQASRQFQQEQEEKKAYGADNKLVTQDRYEELKKRMKQKLLGQLNSGFDPEILQIGAEMAMFHIEAGARKFADYATRMINDLGDAVRPYLQSFYEAARRMPGMEELRKEMDSTEFVDNFDVLSYDKQNDNTVNVNKQENNEPKNDVSLQQKASEEVGRKAEDADKYRAFSQAVADDMLKAMETGEKPYKSIKDIRAKAKSVGLEVDDNGRTDILLQELVEDGLVSAARQYVNLYMVNEMLAGRKAQEIRNSRVLFDDIVKLYNLQPSITQRSSNRIKMQQYSTPLPMSFVADVFAFREGMQDVLEPTAGNGMMVFAVPEFTVHANELDDTRLDNLRAQKFKKVTDQDATQPFEGEQYDAIIANPPFGATEAKEYDGKMISGLAEQIALNALSKMKDDGKAAIIIGGNMEYGPNGAIKSDKAFFTYLYDHYNVKGVIDMDGKLYSKQGTTFPTRMILIDGRRSEEERAQSKVYPPTLEKSAGYKVNSFDELYDLAEEIKNNNKKTDGNEILRTQESGGLLDHSNTSGNTNGRGRSGQSRQNESDGRRTEPGGSNGGSQASTREGATQNRRRGSVGVQQPGIPGLFDSQTDTAQQNQREQTETRTDNGSVDGRGLETNGRGSVGSNVGEGESQSQRTGDVRNRRQRDEGLIQPVEPVKPKVEEKRELDSDKLSYRPHNTAFSLQSVAPAAMVEAMDNTLKRIEKEHGNIDAFVTRELGYDSIEDMHNALAAEQVDSVAMAIYQMKHGEGIIIGDQTGVGKGRQMAALIRWARRQGKKPIFFTKTPDLFSDIYRDLVDIGSGELRPFIVNDKGAISDANGSVVYRPLTGESLKRVLESGKLPEQYDFVIVNYDQVNTGDKISQEEAKQAAKEKKERYQKKKLKKERPTPKATWLRELAKDNYLLLDESHTAAGKGNTGAYIQSILKTAKAVTFASATFAKRPDTMPMYALRTAMSKAKVKADELIKIIENGGVTLQEIMSRALTQAGQMVRRERDMSDVKTDWKTVDDPETVKKARQNYDSTIEAFNAIIEFQRNWVGPYLDNLSRDLADVAASAGMKQGTEDMGISNVPFASKTYNYTKQLMLALKVDAIVDEVVKEIEAGRHPVIALENTMGSLLSEYAPGEVIEDTTFAASLLKGLKGVLRYTVKDEDGNEQHAELKPEQLGSDGAAAYREVEDLIRRSTSGIFISPLDAITEKLQAKGYKVGELTGRNEMAVLDENTGEYKVQRRTDKDKKKLARDFNSGALDVLILNKSASTGISLHASEKFSDQRQRTMIIAQPLADINDYMQMIGRIDRTGQVHRGYYINLGLPVPAEGRFLMMLSTKLKSLNANTTTSQESESNDVEAPDLLNKYGSRVVVEYLRDNPDIYTKLGEPLKRDRGRVPVQELDSYDAQEDDARKITGYVALLTTKEQDDFYNDVTRRYAELIKYLNDTGSNDLKISVLPLRARTIDKQVSSEGSDPNGQNPFAQDAYVEWVEMDVLKKPMKASEVGAVIEQLNPEPAADAAGTTVKAKTRALEKMLNQRMTPRVKQINDILEKEYQAKMDKEDARYEEAKAKAEQAIAEQTEKINSSKRTPEQKKEAIEKYKGDKMQAVEETHNNMVNKIEASRERIAKPLRDFEVGDSYLVPDDLDTDTFMGASPAIFCGFKCKDEGITPSTTLAVFCTLDGRRKIEIKLSDWGPLTRIKNHTEQNWDAAHEVTLSNWDSQIPNESRTQGFIMTGNILQAFADAGQDGRVSGQLVTYTDIDGNVHDGILMSKHWSPSQLKGSTVPIKNRENEIAHMPVGDHVTSADGNVVIERYYNHFTISVPKSKKVGGQYYENDRLLDLVDGRNFYPYRGNLVGDVPVTNIRELVEVLSDLGVQMKSDTQVQFDTESEMGQAMANGSFNNSQNTLSHNAETEESDEKAVPLERRTMKSYTDRGGNYHEGIEEELGRLESAISGTEGETDGNLERGSEVHSDRPGARRLNELRKQASKLRAEKSRREQKKQELRDKYNISEKGDISLDDLSRMFHDLNSSKILGKLFDKVVSVLKNLGVEFRFSDKMKANMGGQAAAFINTTFYNWDAQLRDLDDQEKARILLHEMIHNVASQMLFRYEKPELGELTSEQKKLAKQINDIYQAVKAFNPVRENGKEPYGLEDVHEMIAELANPEFREILDTIPYHGSTVWQQIKNWFKKLIPGLSEDTALDSLSKALDDLLDTYNERENNIYRQQRAGWEKRMRDAGYYGNYVDFWETGMSGIGQPAIVEDADEISRLESEPTEKGYRTVVQNSDGTFGSPMAGRLSGKKGQKSKATSPYKMNQWERSEENPQLATENGKINLVKPGGLGTVGNVDYNPYIHIRENKLNKQFKNAWERPDLVYIEVAYPQSELTSGYKAEKAAKSVGRHKWPGGDLILSRWDKPVRIVPWEEVADDWEREFGTRGVEFDIVSPHLLPILAERGVKILPPHKNMGEACEKAYEAFKAKQDEDPMNAIRIAARQFGKKSDVEYDPMEAIRKSAEAFRKESNVNNSNNPLNHSAKQIYDERLNRVETVFTEAYQDAMVSLKTAQEAIAAGRPAADAAGTTAGTTAIPDSQNAYMAENLMHGKNKNEQDLYNKMFRDPLIETINKIMNLTGMSWGDVDRYVYTKSGLERNRELFVRDWLEAQRNKTPRSYEDLSPEEQDIYDSMAAAIETMFEDGDITEDEKNKKLEQAFQKAHQRYIDRVEADWIRTKNERFQDLKDGLINYADYLNAMADFILNEIDGDYKPEEHDYSGFRAMFGDEEGKYIEADIIDELMNSEDAIEAENVDTLWQQINAATQYGLERYREAGMRSDEQIDKIEQMFHFYVPMRGFKEDKGEDMYQYMTNPDQNGVRHLGGLLKHAKGRGSEADYPISTMFALAYKTISDCNRNLVNQKLYRLCQAHPNDLVILSDAWAVLNETTGEWEESAPEIPEDATEDEVRRITLDWENQMQQLEQDGKAMKIRGKADFEYKPLDKKKLAEHVVEVRINGQKKRMTVVSNPRMAQALNGQLRFETNQGILNRNLSKTKYTSWLPNFNQKLLRLRQALSTNYSLSFVWRNAMRDWTHLTDLLVAKEGAGYTAAAEKYYFTKLSGMRRLFKKYREGTLDESKEVERDFKDFMDNGGITGFVQMQKVDDIQEELEDIVKQQKKGKEVKLDEGFWKKMLNCIEAYNEAIENRARFATYRASRHYAGRTKARSAYDAKEITANFNRRGAGRKTATFKSTNESVQTWAHIFGMNSQLLNENKMFFNATVQAIATLGSGLEKADGITKAVWFGKQLAWRMAKFGCVPFALGSFCIPYLNMVLMNLFGAGDDDDPYANLPEWTRRNNLCIYIGNGNFFTFGLGQELAAFYSLGDMTAGTTFYPDLKPVDKDMADEVIGFLSVFSPVDMETKVTKDEKGLIESVSSNYIARIYSNATPLINISENISWNGRPIYKDDKYPMEEYKPEYRMAYSGTNKVYRKMSEWLNSISGGDKVSRGKIQINPGTLEYLAEQYFGGAGRFFFNAGDVVGDAYNALMGNETDFNIRKVEGVRALFQQSNDRTQLYRTKAKFRKYEKEAEELSYKINNYEKEFKNENDPYYQMKSKELEKGKAYASMLAVKRFNRTSKRDGVTGIRDLYKMAMDAKGEERDTLMSLYNAKLIDAVHQLDSISALE